MKLGKRIFTIILSALFITTASAANNCDDKTYKASHQSECSFFNLNYSNTATIASAGFLGGALATFAMLIGGTSASDSASASQASMPTLPTYNTVGGDVSSIHLSAITQSEEYARNQNQYSDIRLSYSLARGYTGKGSVIAVLDAGLDTWHGKTVAGFASGAIAPDAIVESYKITQGSSVSNFLSYKEIGDVIASANDANIFNASWSASMRANQIYSRQQLENLTDANFISAISNAATQNDAIFVWAAGNDYDKTQSSALSAMPLVVPELQGHFINVVAWDTETGALADYSNACGVTQNYCITAPGTSLDTGTTMASGTSFAAPIVSAATAVIREAFPYMSATQITSLLFETARDIGTPGIDEIYGNGMLDLERATRPVGASLVALENGTMQQLQTARVSGTIAQNIKSANITFASYDSYGRAFETNLSDNIKIENQGRAFERLRANEEKSAQIGNFEFGFKQSDIMFGDNFLQTQEKNLLSFIGTNNKWTIGNLDLYQQARIGFATPEASENSIISSFSNVYTASFGLKAKYKDIQIGIAIPETIISGSMNMRMSSGRADNGDIIFQDYNVNLTGTPAIEYSASYKFITASFIDNPFGTDEFFVLGKKRIRF